MQTQIPFRKTLLATLVAAGIGLTGCNTDTGGTQEQSDANLPGSATVAVSANLPSSNDAQASYIDTTTQTIEVRAFPFPYGSWNELMERIDDPEYGYGHNEDQEGLRIDWENPVNSTTLTRGSPRGEIALTPGTYLIVAGSWPDGNTSGDPLSGSATLVDLDKGEHQVALNMVRATWDIDGTLNLQELNNARGFDWAPGRDGTQSPADILGLGSRLTGLHILFKGGDEDYYEREDSFFGLGFLPGLSQGVVFRTNTEQGWVTPGWGEEWDEDADFSAEESFEIWWDVGSTGALLQDYAPESGNRAFMVLPEMYIEAYRDNWQEDDWQWREAGVFALSAPMVEMLDGDTEYSDTYQTQVCDPDGLNCDMRWIAWQSVDQDLLDLPFDPETVPEGSITNGDTIEVTLIEWQDLDWITDGTWVERDAPPTLDREAPDTIQVATAQRQVHQADKQARLARALQRARFAQQQTAGSAVTTNCYNFAYEDLYWDAQFIWDEERSQWIPGTLDWTPSGQVFYENQFRDPETGELQDKFFAETSGGETRACIHEVALKARQLDAEFQENFPGFYSDFSDTGPLIE
ncbi:MULTISPECIES: hypothetical protein [unclassified Ectothiorhodospira]|uniref:hypothetical protein n=1 Tax=unclassified Ectothiorhodospira TaxID=2684909 RepID=UPI001EE7A2E8|nr:MULTISPECIES: hypothetical protein [unclassified Ectothiorhodospira]MCG5516629.1 hypothetical protein [Ectothiorhodospira sp. 9100]MCG5519675.1 hypothetical protein [Ectothiorhodospira sp. 9905]